MAPFIHLKYTIDDFWLIWKVVVFDIIHYHLHLVFTIHDSGFHQLQGLPYKFQLVNNFFKRSLDLWLKLSICYIKAYLFCWAHILIGSFISFLNEIIIFQFRQTCGPFLFLLITHFSSTGRWKFINFFFLSYEYFCVNFCLNFMQVFWSDGVHIWIPT